jgi:hypothetical protein
LNPWNGKRNPVTLVATVVVRKIAVQPSSRLADNNPNATRNPEMIPTRLMATWKRVNAVNPGLMVITLSEFEIAVAPGGRKANP